MDTDEICRVPKKHDVMLATLVFANGQTMIFKWDEYDESGPIP